MPKQNKALLVEKTQGTKSSTAFNLFVYRRELARQKRRHVLLAKKKVELTENLVSKCTVDVKTCNKERLTCLMRGVVYKEKLKRNLAKFDMWMKMKMEQKIMTQQQKQKCQTV